MKTLRGGIDARHAAEVYLLSRMVGGSEGVVASYACDHMLVMPCRSGGCVHVCLSPVIDASGCFAPKV
eukprot:15842-Eustigmatos_ZCMA.PRE.1